MSKPSRVLFAVDEFGSDPNVVTDLIGLAPTGTAAFGWSSLPTETTWFVKLPEPVPEELDEHIATLLRMLESHGEGVRRVSSRFHARIEIHLDDRDWISPRDPEGSRSGSFELRPELTAAASRLGLGISIHLTTGLGREGRKQT
jgi:hypothetical protein